MVHSLGARLGTTRGDLRRTPVDLGGHHAPAVQETFLPGILSTGTARDGPTIAAVRQPLVDAVCRALAGAADPARAAGQQAYMKSAMPFRGITAPVLTATLRPILTDPALRLQTRAEWAATVLALWDGAAYREERYAAIALAGHRAYRGFQDARALPLYRHMVETGAWWDYVDTIASRRIGPILRADPARERVRMSRWAREENLWVRRTAILSQLQSKAQTDRDLLLDCIEPNLASREFFIAKAIGWALRQYAHAGEAPAQWVREVVAGYGDAMAPLSRREALKHLA